jgi:hypothetical protein
VSAFGKIQAVADSAAHSVMLHPSDQRLVDATLINKILNKPPDWIVGERGNDGGVQPEAALQATRNVVFAAPFVYIKMSRGSNAAVARIEAQHHFPQAYQIPTALLLRPDLESHLSNFNEQASSRQMRTAASSQVSIRLADPRIGITT